jgi:hypothetical protein
VQKFVWVVGVPICVGVRKAEYCSPIGSAGEKVLLQRCICSGQGKAIWFLKKEMESSGCMDARECSQEAAKSSMEAACVNGEWGEWGEWSCYVLCAKRGQCRGVQVMLLGLAAVSSHCLLAIV